MTQDNKKAILWAGVAVVGLAAVVVIAYAAGIGVA